jgi:hypothetical protein
LRVVDVADARGASVAALSAGYARLRDRACAPKPAQFFLQDFSTESAPHCSGAVGRGCCRSRDASAIAIERSTVMVVCVRGTTLTAEVITTEPSAIQHARSCSGYLRINASRSTTSVPVDVSLSSTGPLYPAPKK